MKKFLLLILVVMVNTAFAGNITEKFLVQFASNEHVLDAAALKKLEEVDAFLLKHPNAKIKLTGRTDYDGTVGYNIVLSRNRTSEVAKYLKNKGWQFAEINEKWLGETKPLAKNSNENGKSLNRSVEIEITVLNFENIQEWISEKQQNSKQNYTLKNSSENIITTKDQTILTIPANAFVDENGKAIDNKNVKLIISEVNSSFDAIINQVFTMSGDKIIETGGMINIEAYSGTKPLKLGENKEINIQIPTENLKNDMLVFEGKKDENGNIDWQTNGNLFAVKSVSNRTSLKLNENLLDNLIKQIGNNAVKHNAYNINYDIPYCENLPVKPRIPKKPLKPTAKNSMSGFNYIFSSKKGKENAVEKAYAKKMDKYDKQMNKYKRNLEKYYQLVEIHKDEINKYESEKAAFYIWIDENLEMVKKEKEDLLEYHNKKRVVTGLKKLMSDSKNEKLFLTKPMKNLRYVASISDLEDKEIVTLNYLKGLEYCLYTLKNSNFEDIEKRYTYRKKLRIGTFIKNGSKIATQYEQKNIYNSFLDSFMLENKTDFASLFPNEWKEFQDEIEYKNNYRRNMAEQAKQYEKANEARNYFAGNTSNLGWINCDRYVNQPVVKVNSKNIKGALQVFVMKDIKSIVSTYYDAGNDLNFVSLPKGKKFKLVTFKIENNEAYISIQEGKVEKDMVIEPKMIKMPLDEASKLMAAL